MHTLTWSSLSFPLLFPKSTVCSDEVGKGTFSVDQLCVGTDLRDPASAHDNDLVTLGQVVDAVRHQNASLCESEQKQNTLTGVHKNAFILCS